MLTLDEVLADVANAPGFGRGPKIGVHSRGEEGQTPLHWMATLGDASGIRLLIEAGADTDAVDTNGNTPLHVAVSWRQTAAARSLVELGADVLARNRYGLTALDIAESDGFAPTIELLRLCRPS